MLRHGNHTWKVINVVQNPDDTVSFAFATQSGEVIAQFAVNTHSGRVLASGDKDFRDRLPDRHPLGGGQRYSP